MKFKNSFFFWFLGFTCLLFYSCKEKEESPHIEIETTEGTFIIQLYKETPNHRDNFVSLVEDGFYDGLLFHKVIPDYIIQGGDPNSKNAHPNRCLGIGGLGYTIPAEINNTHLPKKGTVVAARLQDAENPKKESNACQFFIVVGTVFSTAELDTLEKTDYDKKLDIIWQKIIAENRNKIEECSLKKDPKKELEKLQDSLTAIATDKMKKKSVLQYSDKQRKIYSTIGGAPNLENEYTIFGEVIKGLEVVDKINKAETNAYQRPKKDIRIVKMRVLNP